MQQDINKALEVLRNGGTFLYPTDTVWGLGCDATNQEAVSKIFKIKQRSDSKSLIILVDDVARIYSYIDEVPELAQQLIEYAEKPLTLILEGAKYLAPNVVNIEDNSVGIRVVKDEFCRQLIQRFRKPIVSTSANLSGQPTPQIFDEISEDIKDRVDYIVTHRQDDVKKALPSSIILLRKDSSVKVIRE